MKLKRIISIARHRNDVGGAPFDVVLFTDRGEGGSRKVAILFEMESFCAVLDVDKLAKGDIAFGSNSWRGDDYEPPLRNVVSMHYRMLPNGASDEALPELDIQQLLRQRRQVAIVWGIEDVQHVRPDLTDGQAWEVLERCRDKHDSERGFTWTYIEDMADIMFPKQPSTKE
jgi:hypothetical protein